MADSVGMGAYTMDSHNTQRYVTTDGFAKNEGDVQVGGFPPYPISDQSIVPKKSECDNLLVPVCLSATHMAFGSIRMEPVLWSWDSKWRRPQASRSITKFRFRM